MKVLLLFPYPLSNSPSQRFRFEQYLERLTTDRIQYSCHSFWNIEAWKILYKPNLYLLKASVLVLGFIKRILVLGRVSKYDFVFIHRECTPLGPPIFEWVIAKIFQKKIIFDFDDAIWIANTSSENGIVRLIKCHWKVKLICRWSHKVSCGNEFLATYARQFSKNVLINPTTIDTEGLHNPAISPEFRQRKTVTIGWTGTHSTLKYLNFITPVIQRLEARHLSHIKFIVIADKKPDLLIKSMRFVPWNKENEIKDLLQIDIGIMPLTDDIWAQGKCGFKALQYMALKIPTLASPVGVNPKIIDHASDGFLCTTEDDWFTHLDFLINNDEARRTMGEKARKKVISQYSVLSNTSNFSSLFE